MNIFAKVYAYYKKYMPLYIFHYLIGVVSLILMQLLPQILQLFVDCVLEPSLGGSEAQSTSILYFIIDGMTDYTQMITIIAALYIGIAVIRHIIHYTRWNLAHYMGLKMEKALRADGFNKLVTQNSLVLNRYSSGELLTILNQDPIATKDIFCHYIPLILDAFIIITLASFFILRIHPLLAITPAICGVLMVIGSALSMRMMRQIHSNTRTKSSELNAMIQENINGVRVVRALNAEAQEITKFDASNEAFRAAAERQVYKWSKFQAFFQGVSQLNIIASIAVALFLAISGHITKGQFATYSIYAWLITNPFLNVSNWLGMLQQSVVAATRVFTFLETNNIISDCPDAADVASKPHLTLDKATLVIDEQTILSDITLDVPYGKKLGIMGGTGSGKTMLLKLMSRFYEATDGCVSINGTNLKRLKLDSVRRQFGWVMQDVFLFSNTVESNIAFYDPNIPFETVESVAKLADAHDFILRLSEGYDTVIGEKGIGLSGGQKQRLSIARALAKDAPILLFDDATSALDLKTEQRILDAITHAYPDITIIISAHRTSSVQFCDEIIYLDNGSIVERGTHDQLIAQNGVYASVHASQSNAT